MKNHIRKSATTICSRERERERHYILYTDGEISLEVVEVLCQLIAVVIVGEQALEKRQQLRETQKRKEK